MYRFCSSKREIWVAQGWEKWLVGRLGRKLQKKKKRLVFGGYDSITFSHIVWLRFTVRLLQLQCSQLYSFSAIIDAEGKWNVEDRLSQINTLQQLENIASHGFLNVSRRNRRHVVAVCEMCLTCWKMWRRATGSFLTVQAGAYRRGVSVALWLYEGGMRGIWARMGILLLVRFRHHSVGKLETFSRSGNVAQIRCDRRVFIFTIRVFCNIVAAKFCRSTKKALTNREIGVSENAGIRRDSSGAVESSWAVDD